MKNFITYELAAKLQEKGFGEKCIGHYVSTGAFYLNSIDTYYRPNQELDYNDFLKCFNEGNSIGLIDAPTISQVLNWLRKEKKLHIITPASSDGEYWWEVRDFNRGISEYRDDLFDTYEKATLAGIEYVLDNLI